jgi:hypothetical protein
MSSGNDLRDEINDRTRDWEEAEGGSRREFEAAEAATRAWSELNTGLTEGTLLIPDAWISAASRMIADLELIMPRVEHQLTLTPEERAAVKRLARFLKEGL